ncbi:sigma-54-dependent transcriptional regulator [Nitrospira moscoviensis]|uniref:Sigma-54 dependent transcriptional regulator n=1 Tax=Nitrospira moscoviensis TaxID=42253 RepID=A0A0K2GEN3_NITMO|nr:sigma-54 dependent transcriptional regulator [Nitrospira moscoviensis]ALA59406.1 Sigma-54 dependent transcriptional regulator [Nitrospira moscoviensis]
MAWRVLLVEDERSVREAFALRLSDAGYLMQTAGSGEEALASLHETMPDVIVLDLVMPQMSGIDLLGRVRQVDPDVPVIMLTARGTVKDAVEAMRLGAFDFIAKSIDLDDLLLALQRATEMLALARRVKLQSGQDAERYALDAVIARSLAMQALIQQVREVARNDRVTVLLQGETGTGKQFMGRVIHYNSPRSANPYIEVDCPAIPRELFESELFGHEKGSFTGAAGRKCGLIELAEGGTLLFDEIGDLPLALQTKLLRVIEERTMRRVGGTTTMPVDVRFMAATNRDLKDAVAKGEFREDLFFRLNVVTLTMPPLRERPEDIIPLAEQFVLRSALALKKPVRTLGESARQLLERYRFPGNVRELSNLIERAVMFCGGTALETSHFPSDLRDAGRPAEPLSAAAPAVEVQRPDPMMVHLSFRLGERSLFDVEADLIEQALERTGGNKTLAAKHLGINRWMLDRRRKDMGAS